MTNFIRRVVTFLKEALKIMIPDRPREVPETYNKAEAMRKQLEERRRKSDYENNPGPREDPFLGL